MISISLRRIELIAADLRRSGISHVIWDFDGTLSWLRHGWPQVMRDVFLAHAPTEWGCDEVRKAQLLSDILSLNGKPSIHQMQKFCERAQSAGRAVPSAEALLNEYQRALGAIIQERTRGLRNQNALRDEFVVFGARHALELLRELGLTLIILSGTAEKDVQAETDLLGLTEFFGRHIYGSQPCGNFSKKDVIDRIMGEESIEGHHLLAFGDGPVEIQFTKAVGGLAIGVASDEDHNGSHKVDLFKREALLRAGADAIIPDYAEAEALFAAIFAK